VYLQLRPSSTTSAIWPNVMHGKQHVIKPAVFYIWSITY